MVLVFKACSGAVGQFAYYSIFCSTVLCFKPRRKYTNPRVTIQAKCKLTLAFISNT